MDIVAKLKTQIGDDPQYIFEHEALFKLAVAEIEALRAALKQIIERSENGELGTSKVIDMRKIAEEALNKK